MAFKHEKMRNPHDFWSENLKERNRLEDPSADKTRILTRILHTIGFKMRKINDKKSTHL